MKVHGVKRIGMRPFFMRWGKHYCPACGKILNKTKVSKIVNSNSEEAKDYNFSSGDVCMIGNVRFIWTEFACDTCNRTYSVDDIYEAEKKARKTSRQ